MEQTGNNPVTPPWIIRQTSDLDRSRVAKLLSHAPNRHIHLDWYTSYDLLDERPSLIALDQDTIISILACPADPPGIGWIRYFAVNDSTPIKAMWRALWQEAVATAGNVGIKTIAALVTQTWFMPILQASGFDLNTEVIFLEWNGRDVLVELPTHATLRKMNRDDLPAVALVDQQAFQPLWQHSEKALEAAYDLSSFATVMEVKGQIVAYQMSTASALGAHLARLAVHPESQTQGLAKALVSHALRHFKSRGIERMSVNTQANNQRSQVLYEKLGFNPTGQRFPVLTYQV